MNSNYLFPSSFKKVGWFIFIPGIILGFIILFFEPEPEFLNLKLLGYFDGSLFGDSQRFGLIDNNIFDEIVALLIIVGGLFVAFAKEKNEDEFISKIRLGSLVWATYANYIILAITIMFVYDGSFFTVMMINMFTILIFFIIRFNWMLRKSQKDLPGEE